MTALAAAIDATQTLIPTDAGLTNGTFQYPLYYTVDSEAIRVVGRAIETTWLVERGIAGTTAASHSSSATLTRYYPEGATGAVASPISLDVGENGHAEINVVGVGGELLIRAADGDESHIGGEIALLTGDSVGGQSGNLSISTGGDSGGGDSGAIDIQTGPATTGQSGSIAIRPDPNGGSAAGGDVLIGGGSAQNGDGGNVDIGAGGSVAGGNDGYVNITNAAGDNSLFIDPSGTVLTTTALIMAGLPTADPTNAGQLWNDGGTLKVSAG